ncbi:hypothetical protein, partial [Salmonella enterica]|uniref:hypothetical protein n=1 Tax=Salmonella enterica TaxID=28901 RepID=UPI0039ED0E92
KTINSNLANSLGGINGKVSPVVARYLTSGLTVLKSGTITSILNNYVTTDGVKQVGFANSWTSRELNTYYSLVNYDEDYIEVDKYYGNI